MHPLSVTALARAYDLSCPRYFEWMTDGVAREKVRWEETPAGKALAAWGEAHEQAVVARLVPSEDMIEPSYPHGDLDAGAVATRDLVQRGVPFVYQGVLQGPLSPQVAVRGIADLLVRTSDEPRYRALEIKASRQMRTSQMLQAMVYTRLLSRIVATDEPRMVDGLYCEHRVPVDPLGALLDEFLSETIPGWHAAGCDAFHRTMRCAGCPFDPVCRDDARHRRHLSLVAGVTPALAARLQRIGVTGIPGLRAARPANLHALGLDRHTLNRLQGQATALAEGQPVAIAEAPAPPVADIELFLDAEPDPTSPIACRLGVLKRDRTKDMTAYRGVVLPPELTRAQQRAQSYLELVAHQATKAGREHRSWVFLYYGPRTAETLADLVGWIGWGDELLERILHRAVDIHALVRRAWHLPVEHYSFASVLEAVGITPPPDDPPSFVLHMEWRHQEDTELEQRMVAQGEADTRALMALWDWLTGRALRD